MIFLHKFFAHIGSKGAKGAFSQPPRKTLRGMTGRLATSWSRVEPRKSPLHKHSPDCKHSSAYRDRLAGFYLPVYVQRRRKGAITVK